MLKTNVILLISLLVGCSSASSVQIHNNKCEIIDSKCQQALYGRMIEKLINNGMEELGVHRLDPYVLKNLEIPFFSLVKYKVLDGTLKGLKSCKILSLDIDVENKRSHTKFGCDKLVVEAKYKLKLAPILSALTEGINISGDGNGVSTVENFILDLDFPIAIEKLDDGELHFKLDSEDTKYTYHVGKTSIDADNFTVGSHDISAVVVNIVNENWKPLLKIMAPPIMDEAFKDFFEYSGRFLKSIAAKDLISGDLSAFIKHKDHC